MNSNRGWLVIGLSLLITVNLYLLSKPEISTIVNSPFQSLSQIFSLIGTVLLSITFILSSRARFIEQWMGGLDKLYKSHHLIGGVSFTLLIHHPLLLALNILPHTELISTYLIPGSNLAYSAGIISLYLLIILLIATLLLKLPYHLWLATHRFMGLSMLFATIHIFLISSDVSRSIALRYWIFSWIILAIISIVYKRFLYYRFGPRYHYQVTKIQPQSDVVSIYMEPLAGKLVFKPGQFAFFTFDHPFLKNQSHPYSFASNPEDNAIVISVKALGDHTSILKSISEGTKVTIHGPYGQFGYDFYSRKHIVCVAGGIGITPFLSIISQVADNTDQQIYFYYSARSQSTATGHSQLSNLNSKKIIYHPWFGDQNKDRLTANDLVETIKEPSKFHYYFCGPTGMMIGLRDQLVKIGVRSSQIHFEDFNFI